MYSIKSIIKTQTVEDNFNYSIGDALDDMVKSSKTFCVIIKNKKPIGIITERDIVRLLDSGVDFSNKALDFSQKELIKSKIDRSIEHALHLMIDNYIRRLVIIDEDGNYIGTLIQEDIISLLERDIFNIRLKTLHVLGLKQEIISIKENSSLKDALSLMNRYKVSLLIVFDNKNELFGVLSESDILKVATTHIPLSSSINQFVSRAVITIKLDSSIEEAIKTMENSHIRHLVVVDDYQNIMGVITYRDILRNIQGSYPTFLEEKIKIAKEAFNALNQAILEVHTVSNKKIISWANREAKNIFGKDIVDLELEEIFKFELIDSSIFRFSDRNFKVSINQISKNYQQLLFDDVTECLELKNTKESFEKLQDDYKLIFETTGTATFIFNKDRLILKANSEFCELVKLTHDEVENKRLWSDFVYEDDIEIMINYNKKRFQNPSLAPKSYEFRLKNSAGIIIACNITVTMFKDMRGGIASIMDLSAQKRLQSDLMMANLNLENLIEKEIAERIKSEQKYAHFFNSATDAIFIHGFNENHIPTKFIDVNAQSLKLLGYTREELLNLTPIDLNVDNNRVIANAKTLHENENLITETLLKTKDGTTINVELNSKLFHLDNTLLAFTTVRNITEKKRLEKARKEHEQLLIQQSKMAAMGEMIGAIAHQWRQPLNALAIMVQDLEDAFEFGELSKEYIDTKVSKAMSQINFMSKTIDDFRNFFKPNRAKVEFNPIKAIYELLELVSEQFKRYNIQINISEFEPKVAVFGFVNEFKQVILNILNNSKDAILEHSNSGAIDIYFEIDENRFLIHIKDSGGGVPEAIIDRIFEPYFTTKSDDKGTGVGLYMSNIIIEKNMSGKLKVCNGEKGAMFTIELPLNC